jgi:hypothetical protein
VVVLVYIPTSSVRVELQLNARLCEDEKMGEASTVSVSSPFEPSRGKKRVAFMYIIQNTIKAKSYKSGSRMQNTGRLQLVARISQ